MNRFKILLVLIAVVVLAACNGSVSTGWSRSLIGRKVPVPGGEYFNISVEELQTMLANKDFLLVNVHVPNEGDIPETDLSIPFDKIKVNIGHLPAFFDRLEPELGHLPVDRGSKIVLYSRSGSMSSKAAKTLVELGYTNVWVLEGGFNVWIQAGLAMKSE